MWEDNSSKNGRIWDDGSVQNPCRLLRNPCSARGVEDVKEPNASCILFTGRTRLTWCRKLRSRDADDYRESGLEKQTPPRHFPKFLRNAWAGFVIMRILNS